MNQWRHNIMFVPDLHCSACFVYLVYDSVVENKP